MKRWVRAIVAAAAAVLLAPAAAHAATAEQAARGRQCGIEPRIIEASIAARPTLAEFERQVAFANRGAGAIRIIEFADYSCPACKALHPQWVEFAKQHPEVRISVVEFPTYGRTVVSRVTGNRTLDASRFAVAAAAQGRQLAFHDALMAMRGQVNDRAILAAAEQVGLDVEQARALADSEEIRVKVDRNLAYAKSLGITGTPHIVVDGLLISLQSGGWNFDDVRCLVEAAAQQG